MSRLTIAVPSKGRLKEQTEAWLAGIGHPLRQIGGERGYTAEIAGLDAEVRDLKQGYDAIEERARFELGMVRQDEVFVQIPEKVPGK